MAKSKSNKKRTTKTKKPSGLKITRKAGTDDTWIFEWNQGEKYDKNQEMEVSAQYDVYAENRKTGARQKSMGFGINYKTISVKDSDTKKTITVGTNFDGPFYPKVASSNKNYIGYNYLRGIAFRVRGYTKGSTGWSEWVVKTKDIDPPPKPSLGVVFDTDQSNVVKFNYAKVESSADNKPITRLSWQTSYEENGKTNWGSMHHTTSKNGTEQFTTNQTTTDSMIRRFRIRAEGPGGDSGWVEKYHVFAEPNAAVIKSAKISYDASKSTITAIMYWELASNSTARPADKVIVQYQISTPNSQMLPTGTSWTDVDSQKDTSGIDLAEFKVNATIDYNQCFWVRVKTIHDARENWSAPFLATNGTGVLTPPQISNIQIGSGSATITLASYQGLEGAKIAIKYTNPTVADDPFSDKIIGIFDDITGNLTKTIAVPAGVTSGDANLGVYAFFGGSVTNTTKDGITIYTLSNVKMTSATVWGNGDVPKAPTGLAIGKTNDISTVQSTWNFTWSSADGSEVSWADHSDAWYSTNAPSTYLQSKLSESRLNIANLEPGKTWYFRVRLYKTNASGTDVFGPYCDIEPFELTEQPIVPVLTISPDNNVTQDGTLIASWVYVSSDNTQQSSAVIAEVDTSTTPYTYTPKLQFATEQTTEIKPSDQTFGWQTGTTHNIAVKVVSSADPPKESDWSIPVPINVVDPAECHIDDDIETGTNLKYVKITPDLNVYSGVVASFDNNEEGTTINNVMINVAPTQDISEGDPSPEHICPITGLSSDTIIFGESNIDNPDIPIDEASKNLLDKIIDESTEITTPTSVIDLTLNSDYTISISGSIDETELELLISKDFDLPAGNYYYSDKLTDEQRYISRISIVDNDETILDGQGGFTLEENKTLRLRIFCKGVFEPNDILYPQIERVSEGDGGSDYVPYYGAETIPVAFGQTIFGGTVDLSESSITVTKAEIASYNGEELPGKWLSDRDVYVEGELPTIGAQVVYDLAEPQTVSISQVSLPIIRKGVNTFRSVSGQELSVYVKTPDYYEYQLQSLPMTMRATGAGSKGTTTYIIEKWIDFDKERPSEKNAQSYSGEIVIQVNGTLENQVSFTNDNLYSLGTQLDDGCTYRLQAIVEDEHGQVATDERIFVVRWAHQALPPECNVEQEDNVMLVTPLRPEGALESDYINIYRLSSDKPELIYRKAHFNETIVDPYPTIGEYGGYKLVYVTDNGDYTTEDGALAMDEWDGHINTKFHLIDFDGNHMEFKFNVDSDHSWNKSFTTTHYLGGSIQGDWLAGTEHTGNLNGNIIAESEIEPDTYLQLRELATYSGICHVRMLDGSNFTANVNVNDSNEHNNTGHPHRISLSFTKVDNPELDGITLDNWREMNS